VDSEIDIVAVDSKAKNYILGECKFRNSAMDVADLNHLREKAAVAQKGATLQYALFSKAGFTKSLVETAKEDESVKLFSLAGIVGG
jgi:hypothetical protein